MGRGQNNSNLSKQAAVRTLDGNYQDILRAGEMLVGKWEAKISRDDIKNQNTFADIVSAKARGLHSLVKDSEAQCNLVKVAQDTQLIVESTKDDPNQQAVHFQAKNLNNRAREIFILCHNGFVEKLVNKQAYRMRGDDINHAKEVLRNAAWEALGNNGISKYNIDSGLKPLTFMQHWIRANIRRTIEDDGGEGGVRLKSKSLEMGAKVESVAKDLADAGKQVSIDTVAQELNVDRKEVEHVFTWAVDKTSRLDAPIKTDNEGTTVGALIIDSSQGVESSVIEKDVQDKIRLALEDIDSPIHRKVLELFYGLGDNDNVDQKDLHDGVYRDKKNNIYSAESSVLSDRKKRGEKITKKSQRELNKLFESGELIFEPGTPETYVLTRVVMEDYHPDEKYLSQITNTTGVPTTSGSIQAIKSRAEQMLRNNPKLKGLEPQQSRGANALENSEEARVKVRNALIVSGAITAQESKKLMAGRASSGGKSKLRQLAEKHDLINPDNGRLYDKKVQSILDSSIDSDSQDDQSDTDYADLMSSV
jgi:DNA-directed RNA polymerase specialized sigma subunit